MEEERMVCAYVTNAWGKPPVLFRSCRAIGHRPRHLAIYMCSGSIRLLIQFCSLPRYYPSMWIKYPYGSPISDGACDSPFCTILQGVVSGKTYTLQAVVTVPCPLLDHSVQREEATWFLYFRPMDGDHWMWREKAGRCLRWSPGLHRPSHRRSPTLGMLSWWVTYHKGRHCRHDCYLTPEEEWEGHELSHS